MERCPLLRIGTSSCRHTSVHGRLLQLLLVLMIALLLPACVISRQHVYLTWQGDTSQTMTVNYQTKKRLQEPAVYYDTVPRGGIPCRYAYRATGASHQIAGLKDGRYIHTVELSGLSPGTTYYFAAAPHDPVLANADPEVPYSCCKVRHTEEFGGGLREFKFHTIPEKDPVRFVVGGDMGILPRAPLLLKRAAAQDPHFAVIGGDLAYANGKLRNAKMWDIWLRNWESAMVTPDGAMIPMVLAIGNHEINKDCEVPEDKAPFYFGYFAQGGRSYFSRTFGHNTVLFILDSGHITQHGGEQAAWLASELDRFRNMPNKVAVYHVPLYPSHRPFDYAGSAAGRAYWLPLFDSHGIDIAFEHHDHTYKRTKPLRNGQVDPAGTVYLGDGCMGMPARNADNRGAWYLDDAGGIPHFWVVDLAAEGILCRAVNVHGEVFDRYPQAAP